MKDKFRQTHDHQILVSVLVSILLFDIFSKIERVVKHHPFRLRLWSVSPKAVPVLSCFQFGKKDYSQINFILIKLLIGKRSHRYLNTSIVFLGGGITAWQIKNGGLQYAFSIPNQSWMLFIAAMFTLLMTLSLTGPPKYGWSST